MLGLRRPAWAVLLMPMIVGSAAVAIVLVNSSARQRTLRNFLSKLSMSGASGETLSLLRNRIIGFGKRRILSILGPPRAEKAGRGETWYYSVSERERLVLAISFERGRASHIEFVRSLIAQTNAHNS